MYDPEASFAANTEFDALVDRVNLFIERMLPLAGKDTEIVGKKLKQCVELLRMKYDEYLNEFEPVKREQLHRLWQDKATDFILLIKTMAENL